MSNEETRAALLAQWAWIAIDGSGILREEGRNQLAAGLEEAVKALLEILQEEVGEDVVLQALDEVWEKMGVRVDPNKRPAGWPLH